MEAAATQGVEPRSRMKLPAMVQQAVESLCARFEEGDYNLTPIIDLGALVANADGTVDPEEIETLREVVEALLGAKFNRDLVMHLIDSSLDVVEEAGLDSRARVIVEILLDCDAVEQGIIVALSVAFASGGLSEPERTLITRIARMAELPPRRLEQLINEMTAAVTQV